ncbi:sarcosine oxidase subunit gamma family protein [Hoeflea sp.]|uniref:sarcosine oxidase subunit gamma family protein n=1 Tax=Hoeflea sp. TaxID=1940281 RepID=UPI00374A7CBB
MSDQAAGKPVIAHRPALAARKPLIGTGVSIEAMPEGHVIHVLAGNGAEDLAPFLAQHAPEQVQFAVRAVSPGQWFIAGDKPLSHLEVTALISTLAPKADCVDQSHGRVRIRVSGAKVEQMLAKGTAVDLAPVAFPVGHATTTLVGHIAAHITRTDADCFEIIVLRGFAETLWEDLETMGREFT